MSAVPLLAVPRVISMQVLVSLQFEQVEKECVVSFLALSTPNGVLEKQQSIQIRRPEMAGAKIPPPAISAE